MIFQNSQFRILIINLSCVYGRFNLVTFKVKRNIFRRSFMENKGNSVDRLEKLMIKMITFTVFYMAISSLVLFCFIYQFTQLQKETLSCNEEPFKTFKLGRFAAQMMTGVIAG